MQKTASVDSSKRVILTLSFLLVFLTCFVNAQPPTTPLPARETKAKIGLIRLNGQLLYDRDYSNPYASAALVFDEQFAYVSNPGGLYRAPLPLTSHSAFNFIGFQDANIFNLYVNNGSLYVLKESVANEGTSATDHSFLRSDDHGQTFVPIDDSLEECNSGYCEHLSPTQAMFVGRSIIVNAGGPGNLQITRDSGASWTSLLGSMHRLLCMSQALEIVGDRVIVGGDCLETGFLQQGFLRFDARAWAQPPANVVYPDLQVRSVLSIKGKPNSTDVYASISGGLLKSSDNGQNFNYVLNYTPATAKYPYASAVLFPSHAPSVVVIAGYDAYQPFLAYSKDNGESWLDISAQVQTLVAASGTGSPNSSIDFVSEDRDGDIFAGVRYGPTKQLKILRLQFNLPIYR
jgi:hypothetical protein